MNNIILNESTYNNKSNSSVAYASHRANFDKAGNQINKTYLKKSEYDGKGIVEINPYPSAGFHNSIYRGKDITSYFTDGSLYTRISSGTFDDLYIGDFFNATINNQNVVCRLAGFDTFLMKGKNPLLPHHAVIVPDSALINGPMNDTDSTTNGYYSSKMNLEKIPILDGYLKTTFGDHIIPHFEIYPNNVSSNSYSSANPDVIGCSISNAHMANIISTLLSTIEVFGSKKICSSVYDVGYETSQLPLFRYDITKKQVGWLRCVYSLTDFCNTDSVNECLHAKATRNTDSRPRWLIG